MAECTWGEEAVLYIAALPMLTKIVVGFCEKVDGFRTFGGDNSKIQVIQRFPSF